MFGQILWFRRECAAMEKVLSPQVQSLVLSDEEEVSIRGAQTVEEVLQWSRSVRQDVAWL